MKINNFKYFILFAFACFLTLTSTAFAVTIYKGETYSIPDHFEGVSNCTTSPMLSGVDVPAPTSGTGLTIYNNWNGTGEDVTVDIVCETVENGETVSRITAQNFTITSKTREEHESLTRQTIVQQGSNATCGFDESVWSWEGGGIWKTTTSGLTLPSDCKSGKESLTFGGWKETTDTGLQLVEQDSESACAGYSKTMNAELGKSYIACYYRGPSVIIMAIEAASLSPGGEWHRQPDADGYEHYSESASDTVELPTPTVGFGANPDDYAWFNLNTGVEVSGNTVRHDGSTYVYRPKNATSLGDAEDITYKEIYLDKRPEITKIDVTIVDCYTEDGDSTYVGAGMTNGACQVSGNQITENPVKVIVEGDDGRRYIYMIDVVSQSQGNSQNGDDEFEIDESSNIIIGENDDETESGSFITDTCSGFEVTAGPQSSPFARTDSGVEMTSAIFYVQPACSTDTSSSYVAFCLDPGRSGPTAATYLKSNESLRADFKKVINYISQFDPAIFGDVNNAQRIGSHIAVRAVAIYSGQSNTVDRSDATYAAHLAEYQKVAQAMRDGESAEDAVGKLNFLDGKDAIKATAIDILENYAAQSSNLKSNKLTRKIDDGYPAFTKTGSDSYTLTYKGTLSIPVSNASADVLLDACDGDDNVHCEVTYFEPSTSIPESDDEEDETSSNNVVYDYELKITVDSAINLTLPNSTSEQKLYSFKLTYDGPNTVDNIFLIEPANGDAYQRLVVFNITESENLVYIYFPIQPTTAACDVDLIDSLNQDNCTEDSCSDENFNKELFRATGCCEFIFNEFVEERICGSKCTYTNFSNVCSYDPDEDGTTETYVIIEGKDGDEDNLGECVVNTIDYLDINNPDSPSNESEFNKVDDNGDSRIDTQYKENRYCRVTCKEEWEFEMDRFGTLVGENAVKAGTYFTDGSSVFMKGTKTCYTNYIDYDSFNAEEVELSNQVIEEYNKYSRNSHILTEIELRRGYDDDNVAFSNPGNLSISGSLEKNTTQTKSSSNVCFKNKTCAASYGSGYSYSDGKCKKAVTCPEGETGPCYDEQAVECEYYGDAYSYEITVGESKVKDTSAGEDVLYEGDEYDSVTHKKTGSSYNSQIKPATDSEANTSYSASAKLECEITAADASDGDGASGEYKCTLTTIVDGETTTTENVFPSCKQYSYNLTTSTSGNIHKICAVDVEPEKAIYEKYSNTRTKDARGNLSAFQEMADAIQTEAKTLLTEAKSDLNSLTSKIYENDDDMFDCQHFQLYNESEGLSCQVKIDTKYERDDISLGKNREYISISARFEPSVSYTYDESAFMTILGEDNILVTYDEKNDKIFAAVNNEGTDYDSYQVGGIQDKVNSSNVNNDASPVNKTAAKASTYEASCGVQVKFTDDEGNEYELSHDYLQTDYYNPSSIWVEGSPQEKSYEDDSGTETPEVKEKIISLCTVYNDPSTKTTTSRYVGNKEGGGHVVFSTTTEWNPEWYGGECYEVTLRYVEANYIKQSITNSSFYKTKGSWFVRASDVKEHGDDKVDALTKANERTPSLSYDTTSEIELNYWSLLGSGYNVFPIGITTPRNLYQYIYYFGNIGEYNDGRLGRLMGSQKSIISINKRYCFYEVFEDICKCCGDTISTHYDEDEIIITKEYLTNNGLDYTLSEKSDIESSMSLNPDSSISFSVSSVALADLDSDTNRTLGNNWSDSSPLFYNGNNFTTNKGAILKGIIEEESESIYEDTETSTSSMIEYSFHLTPDTMGKIRGYNLEHGYEVNYQNLTIYGIYSIAAINEDGSLDSSGTNFQSSDSDVMHNKVSTFVHLGSKFLEDDIYGLGSDIVITSLAERRGDDNVCQVTAEELGGGTNAETGVEVLRKKMKYDGCRWVDFIEVNSSNTNKYGEHVTTRLAFK